MQQFCCDFETTTYLENDKTRVWAFACIEIGNGDNYITGNSIDDFLKWCAGKNNYRCYFHNEKFDGEFIMYRLFELGYEHVKDSKELHSKSFTTLISDKGQFYSLEICFEKKGHKVNKVEILDSLKILNFSVENIAKSFGLPISKLKIDYNAYRPIGHQLTQEEKDYIRNDVEIVAMALHIMFEQGHTKMTIGSDALTNYKFLIGEEKFKKNFPIPTYDDEIRNCYKGGFTYLNPVYAGVKVGYGHVFDVNSLYPSVMRYCKMPYGTPIQFKGEYEKDDLYDLYIIEFICNFELKKDKIPMLQIKKNSAFIETEYATSSKGEDICLTLTSVDYELFKEQYNVTNIEFIGGFKFKSTYGLFDEYIDKWTAEKIKASKEGNKGQRQIAKLFLNSLYGKFALNPIVRSKYPVWIDNNISYVYGEKETRKPIYLPVGAFITAYARHKTITTSQAIKDYSLKNYGKDMYIYSDTDSIHTILPLEDCKKFMDIDDTELGKWACESEFDEAKFLRAKSYMEHNRELSNFKPKTEKYEWKITVAGMSDKCYPEVIKKGIDNFNLQSEYGGKLQLKRVKGGYILNPTTFKFKQKKDKKIKV